MLKILASFAFFVSCLLLQNCSSAASENLQSKVEIAATPQPTAELTEQENKIQLPPTGKADFNGVSFSYNPQVFNEIFAEEAEALTLGNASDKPDSVMPKRILFTIKTTQTSAQIERREGTIEIIPIKDYRKMYAVSSEYTKSFDDQLQTVKKELRSKNAAGIPSLLPFWDGHSVFNAKAKSIKFQKGIGFFWLTQWSQDFADLFENEKLTLMFQGISDNDRYYVLAEIPVISAFSPENDKEFNNYKLPQGYEELEKHQKDYKNYLARITKRLEKLPSNEFKPNLDELDKIFSTLKIEK